MKRTAKMLLPAMAVLAGCAGTDSYLASRSNMAGMPPSLTWRPPPVHEPSPSPAM